MSIINRYSTLPVSEIADDVNNKLRTNDTLVITAPPGAGKSTLLPLTILKGYVEETNTKGKILLLEPRRLAARHIAERMAEMVGERIGHSIGYRVRFESNVSANTRIEVLTEGILTRMLVDDVTLEDISVVIFDEFHERNLNSDLALALTRQAQRIIRPDLKIVIMSATIDTKGICRALNAPLIESKGKSFHIDIRYADTDTDIANMAQTAASTAINAYHNEDGDILVFLPGQKDIERCVQLLSSSLEDALVMPLYGSLPPERQRLAIAPSNNNRRKIVVSSPIAETSLTIEGVRIVIDSGLCRQPIFEPRTGLSSLRTKRISYDMATQRAGRAGRITDGICYRLWTKQSEHLMSELRHPEIEDADLAPLLLSIAAFGEHDPFSLPWLTPPPSGNISMADTLLCSLDAIKPDGYLTIIGKRMAALPCHPRIARMMIGAEYAEMKAIACDIAAILESKDPMVDYAGTDLSLRISALRAARRRHQIGRWNPIELIASEYKRMTHVQNDSSEVIPEDVGRLIAYAYPERIARSTNNIGGFKLANGDMVSIERSDDMVAHSWIAIASLGGTKEASGKVFLAAPLNIKNLNNDFIKFHDNITWDSREGAVVMRRERRIGKLLIDSEPIHDVDKERVINIVCEAMKKDGLSMMNWNDKEVTGLQRRILQVALWHPELSLPDISTQHLMDTAVSWLPLYIDDGNHIKSTTTELRRLDLKNIIWGIIPYEKQTEIERLAPAFITMPTGSHVRIDYRDGAEFPVVSVRLQECFGMLATPCIDNGTRPVLMELLSPGFKPVQLTKDLENFWDNTYFEVRKELRRRYPKHYWPENPREAEAVNGIKRN